MILLGVAGVFLTYSGVSNTFIHGMQAISALLLLLGIMIFAGGIARGGFPRISSAQLSAIGVGLYLGCPADSRGHDLLRPLRAPEV